MPKVMLAGKFDPSKAVYPLIATPKIDGVRVVAQNGVAYTRSGHRLPNSHVQNYFKTHGLHGFDGEITVGSPRGRNSFQKTQSGALSASGRPDFRYTVFDRWDKPGQGYDQRLKSLPSRSARVAPIAATVVKNSHQLDRLEKRALRQGYEGLVVRAPDGTYKRGRSTVREGGMLKIKPFADAEARVIGVAERVDGKGRKTGAMGALKVQGKGAVFHVGTGFTESQRLQMWKDPQVIIGQNIRYKYQETGTKNLPRSPVFTGTRSPLDMSRGSRAGLVVAGVLTITGATYLLSKKIIEGRYRDMGTEIERWQALSKLVSQNVTAVGYSYNKSGAINDLTIQVAMQSGVRAAAKKDPRIRWMRHVNAMGHTLGMAIITQRYGASAGREIGIAHELQDWGGEGSLSAARKKHGDRIEDSYKDQWNNRIGIQIGAYAKRHHLSPQQVASMVVSAYKTGALINDRADVKLPQTYDSPLHFREQSSRLNVENLNQNGVRLSGDWRSRLKPGKNPILDATIEMTSFGLVSSDSLAKMVVRPLIAAKIDELIAQNPVPASLAKYVAAGSVFGRAALKGGFSKRFFDQTVAGSASAVLWPGLAAANMARTHGASDKNQRIAQGLTTAATAALVRKFGVNAVGKFAAPIGIASMAGDTAQQAVKAVGGSKKAQQATFWGTTALVAGTLLKIGAKANAPALVATLALSVGQHFYNRYKQKQQAQNIAGFDPRQMQILLAGKTPAQQARITAKAGEYMSPDQAVDQAKRGVLSLGGGVALMKGGAAVRQLPSGKAGLLTGAALALYGFMLAGNARNQGVKSRKADAKVQKAARIKRKAEAEVAQKELVKEISDQFLKAAKERIIYEMKVARQKKVEQEKKKALERMTGFGRFILKTEAFFKSAQPPAKPATLQPPKSHPLLPPIKSRTDRQLDETLQSFRTGIHKMTHAGGESMSAPQRTQPPASAHNNPPPPAGPRHVWDDKARKAAALARRTKAAYGKAKTTAIEHERTKTTAQSPTPAPAGGKQAATDQSHSGKIKVSRGGKTYYRKRSQREKG